MKVSLALVLSVLLCGDTAALTWPQPSFSKQAGGLSLPVHITHAGDGSRRLFVVEQGGRIRIIRAGVLSPTPFLDISGRVLSGGERGLLSIAFSPAYASSGRFYVNYTRTPDGATVISRLHATSNPDIADPAGEEILLVISQPFANHNGGQLAFGPDGFLYIGMGDGGSAGDPLNNAQDRSSLLGKILRIDVESGASPYAVPPSNPFLQTPGARPEIWALGLRNPWRFSFDRSTGDLFIADVGQGLFEEVDYQPASSTGGENYGWNIMEGGRCYNRPSCPTGGLTLPVAEYIHADGDCSVTGGMVYRGKTYQGMSGVYLYGDYCTGRVRGLAREGNFFSNSLLLDSPYSITTFGEDEAGEVYLADYLSGDIYRILDSGPVMPLPQGKTTLSFPASDSPVVNSDIFLTRPFGFGPAASGGTVLDLRLAMARFTGPVDIYLGYIASAAPQQIFLVGPDLSIREVPVESALQVLSGVSIPTIGPWRGNVSGPLDTTLFTVPAAALAPGIYTAYLLVTPAGRLDAYYLFSAGLNLP